MSRRKAAALPPVLTGGESISRCCIVDWVSFVLPESRVGEIEPFIDGVRRLLDGTVTEFRKMPGGLHGYAHAVRDEVASVVIAWGGARTSGTVFVQLPGKACARVVCWHTLREFIEQRGGWLSRVDLAYDCIDGAHGLSLAQRLYRAGKFTKNGRPPKARFIDDCGSNDGCTFYVGKRENGLQLCVYEKGKEQGDKGSPWVRWEVRLSNVRRVLPVEALVDPATYFRGSFPALAFVDAESTRIPTRKALEAIALSKLTHHAREAYGPLVDVLVRSGRTAAEVIDRIRRPGMPKRLEAPTADELVERGNYLASLAMQEELDALRGD